jgi:hypothetical protein
LPGKQTSKLEFGIFAMREIVVTPPEVVAAQMKAEAEAKAKAGLLPEKTAWIVTLEATGVTPFEKRIVAESFLYENGSATTAFNVVAFFDQLAGKGNKVAAFNFGSIISIVKVPTTGLHS